MSSKRRDKWIDADIPQDDEDLLAAPDDDDSDGEEGDTTGGVIPYKNPPALIAYYLGLFSLFPVIGFFLGIAAVILGVRGLRAVRARPTVSGTFHAWVGIVCGGFSALAWGICGLVVFGALLFQR